MTESVRASQPELIIASRDPEKTASQYLNQLGFETARRQTTAKILRVRHSMWETSNPPSGVPRRLPGPYDPRGRKPVQNGSPRAGSYARP